MKKSLLTTFLMLVVSLCMTAQEKVIIYYPTGNPTIINVSEVDSIKFVYQEPTPDPTPSDFKPTTFPVAEAVDLGLPSGTKWASWNLGATNIYSYGGYYGWGDPTGNLTAEDKSSDYYKFSTPQNIAGTKVDFVHVKWGGNWTLPTIEQFEELLNSNYTTVTKVTDYNKSGITGLVITSISKPDNFIFIPSAGFVGTDGLTSCNSECSYWTSESTNIWAEYITLYGKDNAIASTGRSNFQFPLRGVYNSSGSEETELIDKDGKDPTANANAGHAVDLGLSVYWADCNIGATNSYDYGDYYTWGSSSTQTSYSDKDYPSSIANKTLSSYNSSQSDYIINDEYDTAANVWGGHWRMPSLKEVQELESKCTWTWTNVNGVNGYKVANKDDASKYIFLPATGRKSSSSTYEDNQAGFYWLASDFTKNSTNVDAYALAFIETTTAWNSNYARTLGFAIRPIIRK